MVAAVACLTSAIGILAMVGQWRLIRARDRDQRQHARERDLMLNQLLHAAGKPWQPAPADVTPPPPGGDEERDPPRYSTDAEVLNH